LGLEHCSPATTTESAERLSMNRSIARLNIEHFEKLLAKETDETKRQTLLSLLTEEKAKLAALEETPKRKKDTA
jgi:hypothetical protein